MACHEHRGFAQDSGLRADGTARLHSYRNARQLAVFRPDPGGFRPRLRLGPCNHHSMTASIELGAGLRYTGSRLPGTDRAIRAATPGLCAIIKITINLSKA